jgi:hypothetical protein
MERGVVAWCTRYYTPSQWRRSPIVSANASQIEQRSVTFAVRPGRESAGCASAYGGYIVER